MTNLKISAFKMLKLFGGESANTEQPGEASTTSGTIIAPKVLPDNLNAAKLHPLANLNRGELEYLDLESNSQRSDGLIASRGWTEDLSYGTGAMYLLGLGVGGTYGLAEGLRKTSDAMSPRLRLNTVLNAVTRRGPYVGNSCGTIAIVYNIINSSIGYARNGKHDDANTLAAAAITGALYRVSAGPKPMLVSTGLMVVAGSVWCVIKRLSAPAERR